MFNVLLSMDVTKENCGVSDAKCGESAVHSQKAAL